MRLGKGFLTFLVFLLLFSGSVSAEHYKQIIIATGSPFELGLINALAKVFEKETGCIVRCIKTPTRRASSWVAMDLPISQWATILRPQRNSYRMGMRQKERTSCTI